MNFKIKKVHRGFTLIELLMAVVIFMIVFLITMAFVNLASGQVKSLRTKKLTADIRSATDTIAQKMNNANAVIASASPAIYGFSIKGDTVLGIASEDQSGELKCTFFKHASSRIFMEEMKENECNAWPGVDDIKQPLTSSAVNVTGFTLAGHSLSGTSDRTAPYLTITIIAEDAEPRYAADNKITVETTYTLDYLTIKKLQF